jgi:hypothetical protein
MSRVAVACGALLVSLASNMACSDTTTRASNDGGAAEHPGWERVFQHLPGALISVWGVSANDVWTVGSDANDGRGPLALHYDGTTWTRRMIAAEGDLWWVHGFSSRAVFAGGTRGAIFRVEGESVVRVSTPPTAGTVYGIWGVSEDDVWAAGGDLETGTGAFLWRFQGDRFTSAPLPIDASQVLAFYKVWGSSADSVWVVGTGGVVLRFDGTSFQSVPTGVTDPLFTVFADAQDHTAIVGGADLGVLLENDSDNSIRQVELPDGVHQLYGVCLTESGGYAVGQGAVVLARTRDRWSVVGTGIETDDALHSVWVDPEGGVWAAGGNLGRPPLGDGLMVHEGPPVATTYADGG